MIVMKSEEEVQTAADDVNDSGRGADKVRARYKAHVVPENIFEFWRKSDKTLDLIPRTLNFIVKELDMFLSL